MKLHKQYSEMFNYLRGDNPPLSAESTVVFGRNDARVAHTAGDLVMANLVDVMVITGGLGKDSGDLEAQGYQSEASYIRDQLTWDAEALKHGLPRIMLDEKATNGGENSRNSTNILNSHGYNTDSMTAVAHATSALRLGELLKHEAGKINAKTPIVFIKPTNYPFDPTNPLDQKEARDEMLRMADWPAKDFLGPQEDLPEDLAEFAREEKAKEETQQ